jgi:hypothetical protein
MFQDSKIWESKDLKDVEEERPRDRVRSLLANAVVFSGNNNFVKGSTLSHCIARNEKNDEKQNKKPITNQASEITKSPPHYLKICVMIAHVFREE